MCACSFGGGFALAIVDPELLGVGFAGCAFAVPVVAGETGTASFAVTDLDVGELV